MATRVRPTSTWSTRSDDRALPVPSGRAELAALPWRTDLMVVGFAMGAGMVLPDVLSSLGDSSLWFLPGLFVMMFAGLQHMPIGLATGWVAKRAIANSARETTAGEAIRHIGLMAGITAFLAELFVHSITFQEIPLLATLGWATVWGLVASIAVPMAAVQRNEGRSARGSLMLLGLVLGGLGALVLQ